MISQKRYENCRVNKGLRHLNVRSPSQLTPGSTHWGTASARADNNLAADPREQIDG